MAALPLGPTHRRCVGSTHPSQRGGGWPPVDTQSGREAETGGKRVVSFLPAKGRGDVMPLQLEMRLFVKGRISLEAEGVVKALSSLSLSLFPPLPPPQPHPQSPAGRFMAWISAVETPDRAPSRRSREGERPGPCPVH